jgi:hypothetical protein
VFSQLDDKLPGERPVVSLVNASAHPPRKFPFF